MVEHNNIQGTISKTRLLMKWHPGLPIRKTYHLFVLFQANQTGYLEEFQPQTKLPINLWIDDASSAYLSPLIYILGLGEIALKWNGEMIGVRHIR